MPPETREPQLEPLDDAPQGSLARAFGIRSGPLTGLFLLAAMYTLYVARTFLLPVVLAGLLTLLLEPVVRFLKRRLRIPTALGAGIILLAFLGGLGFAVYQLAQPAYDWVEEAPQSLRKVERKLRDLKRPVQTLGKATEQVEKIAQVGTTTQTVTVNQPSLGLRLANRATALAAGALVMFILVFFLLASGDLFLRKLIKVLPTSESKRQGAEIARALQGEVSRYLVTVTFINFGLGASTGLAMWWIGLPNPVLWGVFVAIANYIPYLGAGVCYVLFGMLGFLTFNTVAQSLLPIGAFLVLNVTEAYIISPLVLGRRLTLNPVVIFLSLTFWTWLWGVAGAILAVPITAVFKILCDRIAPLSSIGEFLGE